MAQKQVEQLGLDYDIQQGRDKNLTVKDRYSTISAATAAFPKYRERLGYVMSAAQADAKLMADTTITAAYMDAYYKWCMPLNAPVVGAMVNIEIPYGEFWVTQQLPKGPGWVRGSGTGYGGLSPGSTILSPYHEKWNGDPKFRSVMVGQNRGSSGNMSYIESCGVDLIRFEGRAGQWYDPGYESYGYLAFQAGENNDAGGTIRADHFNNYGVGWAGATPGHFGNITTFKNNLGGVSVLGGALSTMRIDTLSGDDNPYLFRCVRGSQPGDGGDEGSMLDIRLVKLEGGTNTEGELGGMWKGQMVGDINGQGGVNIGTMQCATAYYINHAMFRVNPFLPNYGSPQGMVVRVGLVKGVRTMPDGRPAFRRSFIDVANKKTWDAPSNYQPEYDLIYYNNPALGLNYVKVSGRDIAPSSYVHADRLGYIAAADTRNFDEAGGNPKFYFTGPPTWGTVPPPTTCTWVQGAPVLGPCVNGTQTVTISYVSSVDGCVPPGQKPADIVTQQPCGTTPPPTGGTVVKAFASNPVTQPCQKVSDNVAGVTSLVFKGLRANSFASKFICCDASGKGIVIGEQGSIWFGPNKIMPNGTLAMNTPKDVTLIIPATTFVRFGDSNMTSGQNNCNAFTGTWTELKMMK